MLTFLTFFCISSYLLAALGSLCQIRGISSARVYGLVLAWMAVLTQGMLLYKAIETGGGQNLNVLNMLSLISWLISVWVVITTLPIRKSGALWEGILGVFIFPFCAFSVLLAWMFPIPLIFHTRDNPLQLIHIFSSLLAVSLIGLAAVQAGALAVQARRLRSHVSEKLLGILLPLETLESLLFYTIWLGFILLTVSMVTGLVYWFGIESAQILWKMVFVITAWVVFATLLFGRYVMGWRGIHAINWTFCGLILLLTAYIGANLYPK